MRSTGHVTPCPNHARTQFGALLCSLVGAYTKGTSWRAVCRPVNMVCSLCVCNQQLSLLHWLVTRSS